MERASREALDPSLRHKPRLISEEELPSWLLKDVDEVSMWVRRSCVKLATVFDGSPQVLFLVTVSFSLPCLL